MKATPSGILFWSPKVPPDAFRQIFSRGPDGQATRRVEQALLNADVDEIIRTMAELGDISGRTGSVYSYPPERLVLTLWHFFRFTADPGNGKTLRDFLDAAVYHGWNGEETSLEGFLAYSLKIAGVREHVKACAALLEQQGEEETAAVFRKVLHIREEPHAKPFNRRSAAPAGCVF